MCSEPMPDSTEAQCQFFSLGLYPDPIQATQNPVLVLLWERGEDVLNSHSRLHRNPSLVLRLQEDTGILPCLFLSSGPLLDPMRSRHRSPGSQGIRPNLPSYVRNMQLLFIPKQLANSPLLHLPVSAQVFLPRSLH